VSFLRSVVMNIFLVLFNLTLYVLFVVFSVYAALIPELFGCIFCITCASMDYYLLSDLHPLYRDNSKRIL
jgi:hypothetical protein